MSVLLYANTMHVYSQQSSVTSGGNASGSGGEFSYSIGQTDYRYYFSSLGSLQLGLQQGNTEDNANLQCLNGIPDNHVYSYESLCYDAVETLIIAGDGKDFLVEAGGHADLIAGQNIILKAGTTIKPGASLHAWITADGRYCNDKINPRVPCNLETPSQVITSNEVLCFSGIESVEVAGNGKQFVVEPGAHVDVIAGQSIKFKPGTKIKPGASLHAWITTDDGYCADPNNLDIPHRIVKENEVLCFNAIETVNVAGYGNNFIVEPGAHVDIIAGHSIIFRDGTLIKSGGSLHAWITTDGQYCDQPEVLLAAAIEDEEIPVPESEPDLESDVSSFKVYPNPTTGEFTLELLDYNEVSSIVVEIYTIQGIIVSSTQLPSGKLFNFSLTDRSPGIYLIRVLKDETVSIGKIIKR
jgi:phosphotransferase system IIA component